MRIEASEDRARRELSTYAARLYDRGLVAGSSGNLSWRLDAATLLVTPSGRSLRNLAPDEIVACSGEGVARDPGTRPTSELPLHLAAYRVRPEVRCVIHTHPTYCVAWSKTQRMFPLNTVGAIESLGTIAWTAYAPSGTRDLADRCARAFAAGCDTIVMERHGLSSIASDLETAFLRTDLAEQTAHIEFAAVLLGIANVAPDMNQPTGGDAARPRPDVPIAEWRAAAGDHPAARAAIEDFHAEYTGEAPDRARLHAGAERMNAFDAVAGPFERWWLDPRVQAFVSELNATGL